MDEEEKNKKIMELKKEREEVEKILAEEFIVYDKQCSRVDNMPKKRYDEERRKALNDYMKKIDTQKEKLKAINKKIDKLEKTQK